MSTPLLSVQPLGVEIDEVAVLKRLSFVVERGEVLGLVGASGSGKSLTALALMQLLPPRARQSGAVRLEGVELGGMRASELQQIRGRHIGMVFQEPMSALNPSMRIGDQVAETVLLHGAASAARARVMAREALDAVGLTGAPGALDRYPHQLSGGQRQRVAIAIAIVLGPALLIADEPTTALDVSTQAQVLELLRDLAGSRRMGLLLVSHDLAVIAQYTDRVVVMQAGEIVDECVTTPSLQNLRHPYARALLAAAVLAPKRSARGAAAAADVAVASAAADGVVPDDVGAAPRNHRAAAVLEVRGVVRDYALPRRSLWRAAGAFRAVDHATLTIHPGETVGLVGESGSGKSSLLRAILGLEPLQAGEVHVVGECLSRATGRTQRRLRRALQAVFQDPYGSFDPRWSVEQLVSEPFHLLDVPPSAAERHRRVATVLEQVGLSPGDASRRAHEFSGGQRQRIAIARALITEPKVVVFDEAVSALDVLVRAQILELLAGLAERLQLAYLFVTHDLGVLRAIADRVYVMQRGRIVEEGPTLRLLTAPEHAYTKMLVAATPRLAVEGFEHNAFP
jgi:peptide/nickel transport system ATP-binding protein